VNSRRVYRDWVSSDDLVCFTVVAGETDLLVRATRDLSREALVSVTANRHSIETYFRSHPRFATSLEPQEAHGDAPAIIRSMADAARLAGLGPLATVAGAIAEAVGRDLLQHADEVIVENGGDIFIRTLVPRTVGLYAGRSTLSGHIGLRIAPEETPLGICTSSGSFGHSLSFGRADACTVLAHSTAVADAMATMLCNRIRTAADLSQALDPPHMPPEVLGAFATIEGQVGIQGIMQLVPLDTT
jgi:ApbE superfamily uncharacterized protein (UPF0280 family)